MRTTNGNRLYRKGLNLEYFTIGYNILEAIVAIVFGSLASSIALIGFGLDSIIDSLSASVVLWRLRQHGKISAEAEERIERNATRFVAIIFLTLGVYILVQSVSRMVFENIPEDSLPGIIIAIFSIIVMPLIAWQKHRTGKQIDSRALLADSKVTFASAFLSLTLLLGLGANYLLDFWQADPIVGIIIVAYLFREAWKNLKEANKENND